MLTGDDGSSTWLLMLVRYRVTSTVGPLCKTSQKDDHSRPPAVIKLEMIENRSNFAVTECFLFHSYSQS